VAKVVDIERVRVDRLAADLLPAIRDAFAGPGMLKVSTAVTRAARRARCTSVRGRRRALGR
jgi:hypothetical protein